MAGEKQDLRVRKTQLALQTAMLTLLEGTPFSKITVNDICTEAMVSRSAFYVHYDDKYALLRHCMNTLHQKLFDESAGFSVRERIKAVLERIKEDVRVFRNLLMSELDHSLMDMLRRGFEADFEKVLQSRGREALPPLPGPSDVIAVFYAAGVTSAIIHWINCKMIHSIDEMADALYALLPTILEQE